MTDTARRLAADAETGSPGSDPHAAGSSGTSSGAGSGIDPLPSPLDAVADLRSTAKWTLVAAGAVATALITGGPLSAVGQVHGTVNAVLSGAGLVIALGGVGLAIWSTSKVLEPRLTTPEDLASPALAGLRAEVDKSPAWFFGYVATTVDELLKYRVIAVNLARQYAAETDPAGRTQIEPQLRRVQADAARAEPYVRWLVAMAHVWKVDAELRLSRRWTLGGAVLVVIGAVLFFTAAGGY